MPDPNEATTGSMPSASAAPPAEVAEPAPVLASINVRRASNGLIVQTNYQSFTPGSLVRNHQQQEMIFSTTADMITWLKTQGWDL